MKHFYFFAAFLAVASCGVKHTQSQLTSGDYDAAISTATDNLRNNKDAKRKQDYIYLLEEAFAKAKDRDERDIAMWAKDANPQNFEKVYQAYVNMHNRQERIRPLLPLRLLKENRDAKFPFEDYSDQIISSKNALSKYLYDNSLKLMKSPNKLDARKAYDDLMYLQSINPGFRDLKKTIDDAQLKGTDFVSVYTKNETHMVIPQRLENDLLDFSTFGLNDKWTVYHGNRQKGVDYDYGMIVNFREIAISPEQVKEKEFVKEKQIKDGKEKLRDRNGNVVKDSLGNAVMVDKFKTVRINIYEFRQLKTCNVSAKVDYIDFRSNQLLESFPLASEFVFENIYSKYTGDRRAADEGYGSYFDRRAVPFPTNEQMVYDTGEDLKAKLKNIIMRNRIRP
jgi:hypothetical protein